MAPSPPLFTPTAIQVESFSGSLLVGFFLAWGLFGVLSTQVYMYSREFIKDRLMLKIVVYAIYAVQLIQVILYTNQGYQVFAAGFGDFADLASVKDSWVSGCVLNGLVASTVQVFYAWRIWIISGKQIPSALIILASITSLIGSIASGVDAKSLRNLNNAFVSHVVIKIGVWEGSAVLCDIMIAGFTVYYLKRQSLEGSQFEGTSTLVNRIIQMTTETGALTASAAIAALVVTYMPGHKGYFIAIFSTLSGLYSNSFMAILNSRIKYSVHTHMTTWKDGETEVANRFQIRPNDGICSAEALKQHPSSFSGRRGVLNITITQEEMALESNFKQLTSNDIPESESEPHAL